MYFCGIKVLNNNNNITLLYYTGKTDKLCLNIISWIYNRNVCMSREKMIKCPVLGIDLCVCATSSPRLSNDCNMIVYCLLRALVANHLDYLIIYEQISLPFFTSLRTFFIILTLKRLSYWQRNASFWLTQD